MGCSSSKSSPVSSSVLVLGATGNIGKATVLTLHKHHVNVTAGVRDPSSKEAQELANQGVKVIQADMNSEEDVLAEKLKGFESVLINSPGHIDRAKITINASKAAKKAGVQYILVVSVLVADNEVLFGKQFSEIEKEVKNLGISYGILRLPIFYENMLMQAQAIAQQGCFYGPVNADTQFCQVSVQDAGNAAAQIVSHYSDHKNQIFQITSDKKSQNEIASEFSKVLGKEVKYVQVSYEDARKSFVDHHLPEWQADGILELFKLIDDKNPSQLVLSNSFKEATGHNPTNVHDWISQHKQAFGGKEEIKKEGIIVVGASGKIGSATVKALAEKKAHVTAGVRDVSKASAIELEAAGAKLVHADMSQGQSELAAILAHYKAVFLVTPQVQNRVEIVSNAIKAAQEAKVDYLLVVSVSFAGNQDSVFGRQFGEIESEVQKSGLNHGLLRLPTFSENFLGSAATISSSNTFYGPIDGHYKMSTVSCHDAGVAAAEILLHHDKHHNKTYTIVSDLQSQDEIAHSFSKVLGREVKYVNATVEGIKQAMVAHIPEWEVNGIIEVSQLVEKQDASVSSLTHDFKTITGKDPTSNEAWIKQHEAAFAAKTE
ncbi:hypothetical protein ABPG72_017940 [Tetrahymena utriculariae]